MSTVPGRLLVAEIGAFMFLGLASLGMTGCGKWKESPAVAAAESSASEKEETALAPAPADNHEAAVQPADPPRQERVRAPELDGGLNWLNTSAPLHLRDLRGKIVILEFWTSC